MALVAVVAMLTGCTEDFEAARLSDLKVSSSFVTISPDGGSVEMTITSKAAWELTNIPSWVTVSPTSGEAGTTIVKITAEKTSKAQEAVMKLVSNGLMQEINIKQAVIEDDSDPITVAEALALIKQGYEGAAKVKGVVCKISEISPQYGNATYFLSDDGSYGKDNWIEVYRGKWFDGESFTKGDEFSVGDILVVRGSVINYNGNTPEFSQGSEVISIEKSLIKIDSLNTKEPIAVEGGDITAYVSNNGANYTVEIEESAQNWLFIKKFTADSVVFHAVANVGGDRSAKVVFKTTADGKEYTAETTISQKGAIVAATVAEFLAAPVGDGLYRLTGVITKVAKASYGNVYISDYTGEAYIYGIGAKGDFEAAGLKEGDVVTVVGKRAAYNESPQMAGGKLESSISVTKVSIAEFLTKEDSNDKYYMVSGAVDEIKDPIYGNVYLKDGENRLYVYGCYPGWGAKGDYRKNCIETKGIVLSDTLTVIGIKSTYENQAQIKNGVYFSHKKADNVE